MLSEEKIKHLIIHGLGVEGKAALNWFLATAIPLITVIDTHEIFLALDASMKNRRGLTHTTEDDFDPLALGPNDTLYLRSPGITPINPVYKKIQKKDIPHTTPTGYWLSQYAPRNTITITGTKGKSTTASLTAHLLRWAGKRAVEIGNIGRSPFDTVISADTVCVLELSSYMMHDLPQTKHFHAVTNIYREHTDWHGSHEAYRNDKLRPFLDNTASPGILPAILKKELPGSSANLQYYEDVTPVTDTTIIIRGEAHTITPGDFNDAFKAPTMVLALRAAIAICLSTNLLTSEQIVDALENNLSSWNGLPSRQNVIPSADNLVWVDDALATVPEATLSALNRWQNNRIHLLLGGEDRGQEFNALVKACAADNMIHCYVFSKTAEKLIALAKQQNMSERCTAHESLEDMIKSAQKSAQKGDVLLFSPAASSAPPHQNFKERSAIFQSFVPKN